MKSILFFCVENNARSQIAEGMARHFLGYQCDVFSAGSKPADRIHPMAKAVVAEIGIDISKQKPKSVDEIDLSKIEMVVNFSGDADCPTLPAHIKKVNWDMSNPADSQVAPEDQIRKFRKVRDDIRKRVLDLRAADQTW
jgi:arsenate reductase